MTFETLRESAGSGTDSVPVHIEAKQLKLKRTSSFMFCLLNENKKDALYMDEIFPWPHYRPGNMGIFSACNTRTLSGNVMSTPLHFGFKVKAFGKQPKIDFYILKKTSISVEDRLFTTLPAIMDVEDVEGRLVPPLFSVHINNVYMIDVNTVRHQEEGLQGSDKYPVEATVLRIIRPFGD